MHEPDPRPFVDPGADHRRIPCRRMHRFPVSHLASHFSLPCRSPLHRRCGLLLGVAASLVTVLATTSPSPAQRVLLNSGSRPQTRPADPERSSTGPYAAVLHPSEEAATLLGRAKDGIDRQDWKLAIDSLQRIIELPGEHVLTADGQLYESARRHVQRLLAQLPEPGRQAYRLVHDGEAAALFERARREHDVDLCRTVVDRFLLTTTGDEAAVTLADWLMDEGRFSEASGILQWLQAVYPDSDLPAWIVPSRRAICLARLGRIDRAAKLLSEAEASKTAAADTARRDERLRQVRAALDKIQPATATRPTAEWPMALGTASRSGPMPAVEPSFPPESPWHVALPVTPPREGLGRLQKAAANEGLLPAALPVTDGQRVLFKAGARLLALDTETLETVWQSEAPATEVVQAPAQQIQQGVVLGPGGWVIQSGNDPDAALARHPLASQIYQDSIGAQVVLAFGSALTIEWPLRLPDPFALWGPDGQPMLQRGFYTPAGAVPNRLVAYSTADGKQRWSTENSPDLAVAQFLAAPLPVGDHLIAPCRLGSDLYAVVLDPRSGNLVRHVYLCGIGSELFDPLYAISPCVADGVVYFPTGRGVLVAMEAGDFSIRWVSRYDGVARKTRADSWLPTPAIAVADAVLLAPEDADSLLCFDRATGRIRWNVPRANARYVVAANDQRVWVGGETAAAIDIETGKPAWTRTCVAPGGRGILAGERLYLPTVAGLIAFNAADGQAIDLPQPPNHEALGNLLAVDGALFSLAAFDVYKYPDLFGGYQAAVTRYRADPADGPAAIRLAWLELFRGKPDAALTALATVPPSFESLSPQRYNHLVHLKVAAMLDLASGADLAAPNALNLLEQARAIARSPGDAIHSAVALGDHYHRNGRVPDACRQYLSLILSPDGDEMLAEAENYESRARMLAVRRLAKAMKDLSETDRGTFLKDVNARFRKAEGDEGQALLDWAVESEELGQPSCEAAVLLGTRAAAEFRFEQAESCFTRAMNHPASPPALKAEATARLAALYLQPDELHQPAAATALLDRLAAEYASIPLPADVLLDPSAEPAAAPAGDSAKTLPAAQVAARLRERIDGKILARHQTAMAAPVLGAPAQPEPPTTTEAAPILVRGDRPEPLADKWLGLSHNNRVEAHDSLGPDRILWEADLRLLHELSIESDQEAEQELRMNLLLGRNRRTTSRVRGTIDGQTMVMSSPIGLYALGALTGRRLWSRPFDPPVTAARESAFSDSWIWLHQGYLISADARGRLEVCRADAGDRVLWRRTNNRQSWYWVRARGKYVVAMEPGLEQVDIFALADGRSIGSCSFTQSDDRVSIMLFDDVVCGPVQAHDVAAFDLATPGVQRWRVSGTNNVTQIFKPAPDLLAVADQAGGLSLIDPLSGKVRWHAQVESCAEGILDGAVQGDVMYVCGLQKRSGTGARASIDRQRWGLAALRMTDGSIVWQQGEFPARAYLSAEILKASANAIPIAAVVPAPPPSARTPGPTSDHDRNIADRNVVELEPNSLTLGFANVQLTLVDKATGRVIGQPATSPQPPDRGVRPILDVQVWPDRVDVILESARCRFPCPR